MKNISSNGLHHVVYVVKDLEATIASLEKTVGELSYQKYAFKPMKAFCDGVEIPNYELKIAMVAIEGKQTSMEIIEPVSVGYHMDFVKRTEHGGINHICFAVDGNYDEIRTEFENSGARFVFESETEDDVIGYRRCFYAEDTLGNVVEIKENPYFRKGK